ncbi:MAG: HAMP domain-containing histidine kinase [Actinomycetia bacterium]|nr:HAMP domain-containing histidine kinase [Actinomycetes bacterium]
MNAHQYAGREIRFGLRTRIAFAVAMLSLLLSTAVSLTVYAVARQNLLDAREEVASRRALRNATVLSGRNLSEADSNELESALSSLSDAGKPIVAWDLGAGSQPLDPRWTLDQLPEELRDAGFTEEDPVIMRFGSEEGTVIGVAVPIPDQSAAFFEVTELEDITDALESIRLALAAAVIGSTVVAALVGYWASRYTIRPLTRVSLAAQSVAAGQLDTRLDYSQYRHDPDLAPLVANFNGMLQALQTRINRDARFASDVSHELRSPLTTLNAGLQVLDNNRDEMPERARQALDLLALDVDRFTQLVEDLLEISRFDAGAVRLELDDVALAPMVRSTVATLTDGGVPVEADPEVESLVIACDKRRLAQILANFLNNAEKYGGGATSVSVSRHDPDPEHTSGEPTVRIAVEDAGPGVPVDQREAVFDRFNRGDQGGARGADIGVGLGLALAAEHARLQAGRVWVEDREDGGQGARFTVELPLLEVHHDISDPDDLAAATPESTSNLTLTGEHRAIVIPGPSEEDDR